MALGQSRSRAVTQFLRNEIRLLRNPDLEKEYYQVFNEYVQLKHMVPVPSPYPQNDSRHSYLPHHAAIKPKRSTTKIRVVFNTSSDTSNGQSLNDVLLTGSVLQSDLTTLLLKWRLFRYVFNEDIGKMYRQILVRSDHTPFQLILFRNHPGETIHDFKLQTGTVGVICAPYLAIRILLQLADDVKARIPRWLKFTPSADIQFHGFYDASYKAFTATFYVRIAKASSVSSRYGTVMQLRSFHPQGR
ncbi:uncharacterized protein [Musca autumnalis]|uniref:uncharacterized protein n=1 Tax=Musca autumnalis TaxID=221902 RepID=UPI003CF38178